MNPLQAAGEVASFLEERGFRYFVMGGLALQHRGEPRLTRDLDIAVLVGPEDLASFVDAVSEMFPGRIAGARDFARKHWVLLKAGGVPVALSLGEPGYEEEAWEHAVEVDYPGAGRLRLVSAEDLVIQGCPRDEEDVESVLPRQRLNLDIERIRRWLDEFRPLADSHDPPETFERALSRARKILEAG